MHVRMYAHVHAHVVTYHRGDSPPAQKMVGMLVVSLFMSPRSEEPGLMTVNDPFKGERRLCLSPGTFYHCDRKCALDACALL